MGNVLSCLNAVRSGIVRHDFMIVVLLSVVHIGMSCMHLRESATLNLSLFSYFGLLCWVRYSAGELEVTRL